MLLHSANGHNSQSWDNKKTGARGFPRNFHMGAGAHALGLSSIAFLGILAGAGLKSEQPILKLVSGWDSSVTASGIATMSQCCALHLFFKVNFYLSEKHSDRKTKRSSANLLPKWSPRPGPRASSWSPMWAQGPSSGAIFCCFPRDITRELDRKQNRISNWHPAAITGSSPTCGMPQSWAHIFYFNDFLRTRTPP